MASLRARLFVGLAAAVLAVGVAAGGLTFRWAFREAIEAQDAILVQIGAFAVKNRLQAGPATQDGVDADARVTIAELGETGGGLQAGMPSLILPATVPDGLQTVERGQEKWRVIVRTRPDGSRVAVGQPTGARDELARDSALRSVLPLCALIPILMGLVGIVINYSLRPVSRLAFRLDAEQSGELQNLPMDGIPSELRPFIESINRLLGRIGAMLDHQRRFIADAAHELRTPITALGLQADNLDHEDLPAGSRDRLVLLRSGIRRIAHLLEQLLALARYDGAGTSTAPVVALDEIVKSVVADLLPLAQSRSIDLGFERIETVAVRIEPAGLSAVARNAIDNALRYSFTGGTVNIAIYRRGDDAILRIEDAGPGIPNTDLALVFEPFNRGSRPQGDGSGLGLSIVRRIVTNHLGSVSLENIAAPQRGGLRLTVTFPVAAAVLIVG